MIVLLIVVIALAGAITNLIPAYRELRYEERRTEMIKQLQTKKTETAISVKNDIFIVF